PARIKLMVTNVIAEVIYLPLTHLAFLAEKMGFNAGHWLLSSYKNTSFYTVRTDFRDSFSIPLEQLFAKNEITTLMHDAGVENIRFSNSSPFRCAVGQKQQASQ
ncbi:SAM-dependent methyltransferase, partial [bacterium]|nr:SAM-dependent methyltransferase [bacterium]